MRAPGAFGGYQAIGIDPDTGAYTAASDPRKDGLAVGYGAVGAGGNWPESGEVIGSAARGHA